MKKLFLYSIFSLMLSSSCNREFKDCPATFLNKTDNRLTFVNNASGPITFGLSYDYPNDSAMLEKLVPTPRVIDANPNHNIPAGKSERISIRGCWEARFEVIIPSGKLRIMVFEIDSVKALPASEIIRRGLYKNYLYSLDELINNKWQIVYP